MITVGDIKRYARELGADLVGLGSMDRFEGAPLQYDPRQIMPKAKSIIGLGFRRITITGQLWVLWNWVEATPGRFEFGKIEP